MVEEHLTATLNVIFKCTDIKSQQDMLLKELKHLLSKQGIDVRPNGRAEFHLLFWKIGQTRVDTTALEEEIDRLRPFANVIIIFMLYSESGAERKVERYVERFVNMKIRENEVFTYFEFLYDWNSFRSGLPQNHSELNLFVQFLKKAIVAPTPRLPRLPPRLVEKKPAALSE